MIRRISTAMMALASMMLLAGAGIASADHDVAQAEHSIVIHSVDKSGFVWDEGWYEEVILYQFHGESNQRWTVDRQRLISHYTGNCAAARDDRIVTEPCDGEPTQDWHAEDLGGGAWLVVNEGTGLCATHDGDKHVLLLRECDAEQANQRWIIE